MIYKDKILHFGISLIIAVVSALFLQKTGQPVIFSVVIVLLIGVGKEVFDDLRGGRFDIKDLFADVFGGLVGLILVTLTI